MRKLKSVPTFSCPMSHVLLTTTTHHESSEAVSTRLLGCIHRTIGRIPSILVIETGKVFPIEAVRHLGSTYSLRAAIRHQPQHFIFYVRHNRWFLYNGYPTLKVTEMQDILASKTQQLCISMSKCRCQ
jgi:hypothetical protein